ncbi:hypothetical protein GWK47_047751 [Chionoecetes opilio]|uniref:Uncharacterized protein n=1 Tax=Chionoecetes opilio TaxID=41210 RepID=A0A8J5CVL4_CHIOP|nr:hypothetical protein GWK47_047751 [Chionoecetes opilio]
MTNQEDKEFSPRPKGSPDVEEGGGPPIPSFAQDEASFVGKRAPCFLPRKQEEGRFLICGAARSSPRPAPNPFALSQIRIGELEERLRSGRNGPEKTSFSNWRPRWIEPADPSFPNTCD